MTAAAHKVVATESNFSEAVVEASQARPVLVDFWAPWCGPCRTLMPMLDRLADEYGGRFTLAKVNTDEEGRIAGQYGIRSIPTVLMFHRGEVVDQFVGVQPESSIRELIDRHLGGDSSPKDPSGPAALAAAQLDARDAAAAAATIAGLEASEPGHPALGALRARLAFLETAIARPDVGALRAALEADPRDSASRHALAAHHALAGDWATALSEWLELMRRDRGWSDGLARRSVLMAFEVLGETHELVAPARRRMASLLH